MLRVYVETDDSVEKDLASDTPVTPIDHAALDAELRQAIRNNTYETTMQTVIATVSRTTESGDAEVFVLEGNVLEVLESPLIHTGDLVLVSNPQSVGGFTRFHNDLFEIIEIETKKDPKRSWIHLGIVENE